MRTHIQVVIVAMILLTGCVAERTQPRRSELLGNWKTGIVQTEWGSSVLEVAFTDAGDIEFNLTPAAGGQSVISKGKYHLDGKNLIAEVFNKGEPVSIWLEGNRLVIQIPSEPAQHFIRQR